MGLSFSTWPQGALERCVVLAVSLAGDGGVLSDTEIGHLTTLARHELPNRDESEVAAFLHEVLAAPELHAVRRTAASERPVVSSPSSSVAATPPSGEPSVTVEAATGATTHLASYGIDKLRRFENEYRTRLAAAFPEFALPPGPMETPTMAGMSRRQLQSERAAVEGRIDTLREWEKKARYYRSIGNTPSRDGQNLRGDAPAAGVLTPEDVLNIRFQPTKHREGYDQDEVDNFLDEVAEELRWRWANWFREPAHGNGNLSSTAVINTRFQPTKHREGYDQDEVDDFMDRIVATLRAFEAAGVGSGD